MKKQLINRKIANLIESDQDFNLRQEKLLKDHYNNATANEKIKIDNIFIALCGYSLNSIINFKN